MKVINKTTVLAALANHVGAQNGSPGCCLATEILGEESTDADERQMRKVIQSLREEGSHICGRPGQGYFMAANETELDETELDETCTFIYGRCKTGLKQITAMKKVSLPDLLGQLRLPG